MSAPPSYDKSQAAYPDNGYGQPQPGQYVPPPGPGGYQAVPPSQVVVVRSPPLQVGRYPVTLTCPNCHAHITTRVRQETGTMVWMSAGLLCVFGLVPCACIPFCIDSLKDHIHTCPNCNALIGEYKGRF